MLPDSTHHSCGALHLRSVNNLFFFFWPLLLQHLLFLSLEMVLRTLDTGIHGTTAPNAGKGAKEKAKSAVLHRHLNHEFLTLVRGEGNYLIMEDGQRILDASGGAAVGCIGWGNKRVAEAIMEQVLKAPYCSTIFYTTSVCEELCRMLVESTDGHMARANIVNSGGC